MRYPRIVVYEYDGKLAELLRGMAAKRRWSIREPRRSESCLRMLQDASPCVFVLRVGADLPNEMTLLDRVSWLCPDAATLVVTETDHPTLVSLAWELGAAYVHWPPASRGDVPVLVEHAMEALIAEAQVISRACDSESQKDKVQVGESGSQASHA
jgi:hypothetical protein